MKTREGQTLQGVMLALRYEQPDAEVVLHFAQQLQPTTQPIHLGIIALAAREAQKLDVEANALQQLKLSTQAMCESLIGVKDEYVYFTIYELADMKLRSISEQYRIVREVQEQATI